MAGLCETEILEKVILRNLNLTPPEDSIYCFIDSKWPLPGNARFHGCLISKLESIQRGRVKLASACLRDFLQWMNTEAPGSKRRHASIGDQKLDDLIQLILDGLCRDGAETIVFQDIIAPLLR